MNWLDFISSIVGSVAWPIAFVFAALVFRQPLRELMKRMTDVEVFGNKATFKSELERGEIVAELIPRLNAPDEPQRSPPAPPPIDYLKLASEYPSAAVIEAYKKVEEVLTEWQDSSGMTHPPNDEYLVKWLVDDNVLSSEAHELYQSVSRTRNIAVHTNAPISTGEAIAYRDLCNQVVFYLKKALSQFNRNQTEKVKP